MKMFQTSCCNSNEFLEPTYNKVRFIKRVDNSIAKQILDKYIKCNENIICGKCLKPVVLKDSSLIDFIPNQY